ncbi:hypothetical protein R6Q59_007490 [Mikania micrantha]
MEAEKLLKFSLEEIKLATNNFSIGKARHGFWSVYTGKLGVSDQQRTVAVRRLDREHRLGDRQFLMEIQLLLFYKHEISSLLLVFVKTELNKIHDILLPYPNSLENEQKIERSEKKTRNDSIIEK